MVCKRAYKLARLQTLWDQPHIDDEITSLLRAFLNKCDQCNFMDDERGVVINMKGDPRAPLVRRMQIACAQEVLRREQRNEV